jgi:glutamine cyclotransferase
MKQNRISYALAAALVGTVALVGCKKKEEPVAAPPAVVEPAPAPAPVEPVPAPMPVSATSVTVGNTAAADKSVAATGTFGAKDQIIVSVKTDASTPADATLEAKLTFQDGQEAGKQTQAIKAEDAGTTNLYFKNSNPWPAGKYKVDVTLNGQPVGMTQEIEVK